MKIKATHDKFGGNSCIIESIFYPKESGLQFKVTKGDYKGSLFSCGKDQFTFTRYSKFNIFLIEIVYFIKMNLFRKIFKQIPHQIKIYFGKKPDIQF